MSATSTTAVRIAAVRYGALRTALTLVGFGLRRDRWLLVVWVLVMGLLPAGVAVATPASYPDQAARDVFAAESAAVPSQVAARGPIFAATVGGLVAWTTASSGSLVMGVAAILMVIRHTRGDEQAGRTELLAGRPAGRTVRLLAALAVPAIGCLGVGVVAAVGLLLCQLPVPGSLLLGALLTGSGLVYLGAGALAGQVAQSPAVARGLGIAFVGVTFAVAAVGDLAGTGLVWASPLGWARHAEAFVLDRGWVVGLQLLLALLLVGAAVLVSGVRDHASGIVPERRGRSGATRWLTGSLALAWRRQRTVVLVWALGLGVLGLLLGSVVGGLDRQLDTPAFRDFAARIGNGDVAQVFFQFVVYVLAQVATAAALGAAQTMRADEVTTVSETQLGRPVTRWRWAGSHLAISCLVGICALGALGLGAAISTGTPGLLITTLTYLPAVLVVVALQVAVFGWWPRAAVPVSWAVLALLLVLDLLGEFSLVPAQVMDLSPYALSFAVVLGTSASASLLTPLVVAAVLVSIGVVGLRRRDLAFG